MVRALPTFFILIFAVLGWQQAVAHPHVWITAKADLVFDRHDNFVAVRHQWVFDEAFSAYATVGLDKNRDGRFSRKELAKLARINVESIADFQYFTFIRVGEYEPDYDNSRDYWLEYRDDQLVLFFTLPMAEPVKPDPVTGFDNMTIEIFDPMFFANVTFATDTPVNLYGPKNTLKTACSAQVALPQALDPVQTQLLAEIGPGENIPADLAPDISYLANTITVNCPTT